jgi:hypothetical protein
MWAFEKPRRDQEQESERERAGNSLREPSARHHPLQQTQVGLVTEPPAPAPTAAARAPRQGGWCSPLARTTARTTTNSAPLARGNLAVITAEQQAPATPLDWQSLVFIPRPAAPAPKNEEATGEVGYFVPPGLARAAPGCASPPSGAPWALGAVPVPGGRMAHARCAPPARHHRAAGRSPPPRPPRPPRRPRPPPAAPAACRLSPPRGRKRAPN